MDGLDGYGAKQPGTRSNYGNHLEPSLANELRHGFGNFEQNFDRNQLDSGLQASDLATRWLTRAESRFILRSVSEAWFNHTRLARNENLGMIRREVWDAECRLQPFPDIAVASVGAGDPESEPASTLGLLCGTRSYGNKYFFIQHLALHPAYAFNTPEGVTIGTSLVTAAIDLSLELGCYGWLATAPSFPDDSPDKTYWIKLGFSRYDPFTYRKMGYFN